MDPLDPMYADLNEGERRVVNAAREGGRAQCRDLVVRASILRAIFQSSPDWVQPSGIALHGAQIEGVLDLEGCVLEQPLLFFGCRFGEPDQTEVPLVLRDARLKRLGLYACRIHGGINGERVQVESALFMGGAQVWGPARLRGARVGGSLNLEEAVFRHDGPALVLDSAEVRGNWLMRDSQVHGGLRFPGARIGGNLLVEGARFEAAGTAPEPPASGKLAGRAHEVAIVADGAVIGGAWVLSRATVVGRMQLRSAEIRGMVAIGAHFEGPTPAIEASGARIDGDLTFHRSSVTGGVSLHHAKIDGLLNFEDTRLDGASPALDATGIVLEQGLNIAKARLAGGLGLEGARIGRDLQASGVSIACPKGRAIQADGLRLAGNWLMRGAEISGTVRIPGAKIDGQLAMTNATIAGGSLALRADGVRIDGGWFMGRLRATGVIRFPASTIGNQLRLAGATLRVSQGAALYGNGSTLMRGVVATDGFSAIGAIALDHTRIHGALDLRGSTLTSAALVRGRRVDPGDEGGEQLVTRYDTAALSLVDAVTDRLQMPDQLEHRPRGIVDLARGSTASLADHQDAWPPEEHDPNLDYLVLDGFTYEHLENPAGVDPDAAVVARVWETRLRWLEGQSKRDLDQFFKPAPWVQLARRLEAQGYHEDARQISIARQRRHRRSASVRWRVRLQSYLLDLFALFGFNPWRTVAWIAAFVVVFAGVWALATTACVEATCNDETVFVRSRGGDFAEGARPIDEVYPAFSPLAYSFDLFVPVVDFGHRDYWQPNTRYRPLFTVDLLGSRTVDLTVGELLYLLTILEMIAGLILTSLAVTGFTGLIGRDDG